MAEHARTATTAPRDPSLKRRGRFVWLLASALLPGFAAAAPTPALVTDHVVNTSGRTQRAVTVTFGQVFRQGDVPRAARIAASVDGKPVALQVDAKASWPDGSLRHAVLTAQVPVLAGHANASLALHRAPDTSRAAAQAVSLAQLLASDYDATIALNFDGTVYSVDARRLLQRAASADSCKPWGQHCNLWLSGPLASAWVVHGTPTATGAAPSTDDTPAAHLRVYFAVRAYAGATPGSIGRVRTDIVVENTDAFAPQAQPHYTAQLASGSAACTSPALTQYAYTRWHKVLWWNEARPDAYVRQDTDYIQSTRAVSRYMSLRPDADFLAGLRQTCAPLDNCDQTARMGNTGAQAAIGPLPRWTSVYIIDPDPRAYRWMLANTDALGAYSIHYRDAATGYPVSIRKHPHVTIANWQATSRKASGKDADADAYRADLLQQCTNNKVVHGCDHDWYATGNPYHWDNAHQPAEAYVPYMVTGSWYYMSELAFAASMNTLWSNDAYRGYAKGLIGHAYGQIRGKAWVLRQLADAAWLLPDTYPLKAEFKSVVDASLADWNAKYTRNPNANPLGLLDHGVIYKLHGDKRNGIAPWQHSFLTWSVGHAAELGFPGASEFRDWLARFEIGLMTDWQDDPAHGYCWLEASAYKIEVKDAAQQWLPSYSAVYAATFPRLAGLACNAPAMVAAMGKVKGKPWQAGKMSGFGYSATGFPSNLQIGLATAADSGLPRAHAAWQLFQSRSVKPKPPRAYNNYPNFALLPRSLPH